MMQINMRKTGQFWDDTFEQLAELGKSTTKKAGQAIVQTFSPLKLIEQTFSSQNSKEQSSGSRESGEKKPSHTPLDFEKLQQKYQKQDEAKLEQARQRLFSLVKKGEQEAIERRKKEEQEKLQKEYYQKQKEKEEEQKRKSEHEEIIPRGKARRSIFSPKKFAQKQHAEIKPSTGKQ